MFRDTKVLHAMYFAFLSTALGTIHPEKGETWEALGYYHDGFTEDARAAAWRECRTFLNLADRQGYPVMTPEAAEIVGIDFWLSRTKPDPVFSVGVLKSYSPEAAEYYDDLALCFGNINVACDENDNLNLE